MVRLPDVTPKDASKKEGLLCATVASGDILPVPKAGFTLYLFTNPNNDVIASSSEQSALSIIDVNHISQLIAEKQNLSWQDLTSDNNQSAPPEKQKPPGFSHYLDLQLTAGEYRVFVYPYQLSNKNKLSDDLETPLYLLGVLPKSMLEAHQSQRWNLSLLSLILVILIFVWVMSRLFMLSNNQPVGDIFYRCTMACSYFLFVMIVALLLAYGEKSIEQDHKKSQARQLMTRINHEFDQEMGEIIVELNSYRKYYRSLLNNLSKQLPNKATDEPDKLESVKIPEDLAILLFQSPFANNCKFDKNKPQCEYSTSKGVLSIPTSFEVLKLPANEHLLSHINLFGPGLQLIPGEKYAQRYLPNEELKHNTKILNTLLLDKNGNDNMPMFFSSKVIRNLPATNLHIGNILEMFVTKEVGKPHLVVYLHRLMSRALLIPTKTAYVINPRITFTYNAC